MKKILALLLISISAFAADPEFKSIGDLDSITSPSANAVIEIEDSSASPQSRKMLLNLIGVQPFYRTRTTISVSNTVTETSFLTNTITAGLIGTNKEIVIRAGGKLLNTTGSAQTYTLRMYIAGTEVYEDASPSIASSAFDGIWTMTVRIVALDATNIQKSFINLDVGGRGAAATGVGDLGIATPVWYGRVLANSTADSTADMGVGLTIVNGATGVMDWSVNWATITVE